MDRDIVGFTGKFSEKEDGIYSLETFIYKTPDFYNQVNLEYDSKTFLEKNPIKVIDLLTILHNEFWCKGWVHGDLDSSNILIQYKDDDNIFFRIFDFEEIEYSVAGDRVGFFKFIWSDIRKFIKEYLELELVKDVKNDKCYWLYQNKIFNSDNNLERFLCDLTGKIEDDAYINFRKYILVTLDFIANFTLGLKPYTYTDFKDFKNLKVVYDNMILSEND